MGLYNINNFRITKRLLTTVSILLLAGSSALAQSSTTIQVDKLANFAMSSISAPGGRPPSSTTGVRMIGTSSVSPSWAHVWCFDTNQNRWVSMSVNNFIVNHSLIDQVFYGASSYFRFSLSASTSGLLNCGSYDVDLLIGGQWVKMSSNGGQTIVQQTGDGRIVKRMM